MVGWQTSHSARVAGSRSRGLLCVCGLHGRARVVLMCPSQNNPKYPFEFAARFCLIVLTSSALSRSSVAST